MKPSPETSGVLAQAWRMLAADPGAAQRVAQDLLRATPANADATLLLAAASRRLGEIGTARALLAPLIARRPKAAAAWFEWGMTLSGMGLETEAVEALRQAVALEPQFTGAWRALGDQLLGLGAGVASGEAYAHAAHAAMREPRLAEAAAALARGRAPAAESLLIAHVRQHPADARAHYLLGEAAMRVGRVKEAAAVLQHCLDLAPGFAEARHSLAILLYTQSRFGEAIPHFRMLLAAAPHQPGLRPLLAASLMEVGDAADAATLHEGMLAAWRDQPRVWLAYGHALKTLGREADAATAYRTCIGLAPSWSAGAWLSLADLKTVPFTDAEMATMQGDLRHPRIDATRAAQLHYALGQAHEQRGAFAAAFRHFAQGAALQRRAVSYDAGATTAFVAASRHVFTADFFARRQGAGCRSPAPIFIVGLPRSGSTLVEQILASHPEVEGTTELKEIGLIAAGLRGSQPAVALPSLIGGLDHEALRRLGERYLNSTRQFRRLGRPFFTDKMPDNFLHAGLIHLILPDARIIDVRRAPIAAGLAAFKQFFQVLQTGQAYTYDLAEIGRYYRDYVALMAHFGAVLPGRIHRVDYERLVTDTEREIRTLLAFCELDFDAACLRFWETSRPVQTPSAQQVRRPISLDGLEGWRRYEQWLEPLRAALDAHPA